ncbi:MAG: fibronectin type III domain-containing protein [Clostridiales bacterium]|nr:fibronectin type III domain-containing protein [Clostridiales bacterium]
MKRNFLKHSLALFVAAAITVSSVPTSLVFAEEAAVETVAEEATEVAAVSEEAAVETEAETAAVTEAQTAAATEAETTAVTEAETVVETEAETVVETEAETVVETEAETAAETAAETEAAVATASEETVASTASGYNTKAADVTDLQFQSEYNYEEESIQSIILRWNQVETAYRYEILVTDAAGNIYANYYSNGEFGYYRVYTSTYPSVYLSNLVDLYGYTSAGTAATDANGNRLKTFVSGTTYKIYVRAVNRYYDGSSYSYYPGNWSSAISYTAPAVETLTNLSYSKEENGYYYFTYSGTRSNNAYLYYQIATDSAFTNIVIDSSVADDSYYKLSINGGSLTAGKTYYIRAWFSNTDLSDSEIAALNPSSTSFTTKSKTTTDTVKQITGLEVYNITSNYVYFHFNPVFDDDDNDCYYIIQYATSENAAESDWKVYGGSYYDEDDEDYYYNYQFYPSYSTSDTYLYSGYFTAGTTYYIRAKVISSINSSVTSVSNVAKFTIPVTTTPTAISGLTLKEYNSDGYRFTVSGTLNESEYIQYSFSTRSDFSTSYTTTMLTQFETASRGKSEFTIYYYELTPGTTYYVRARVYNPNATTTSKYSSYTSAVTVTATIPSITLSTKAVTSNSVTLKMSVDSGTSSYVTGYQAQRKIGSSYKTIAKTTDNSVKDSGLSANKSYTYRVRPYYYNSKTGTTAYGNWEYVQAMTWGGSIKLKASTTSKTSIKLSWNKVSGATGYEVYRTVTSSDESQTTGSVSNSYSKYTLVKTIKKASTVTYTNKKLNSNLSYTYYVRAYKTVNGKKYYIDSNSKTVNLNYLKFGSLNINTETTTSTGAVTLTWTRVYSASGYLIEKYDNDTYTWKTYKTLSNTTSSYTFPAVTDGDYDRYRIRAYNGKNYSNAYPVYVYPYISAPTGVTATANSTTGAITVSWKAVSGAAYYRVYRTTSASYSYDTSTKTYSYESGTSVPVYTADATKISGYTNKGYEVNGTSIVDRPITYTYNGTTNTIYSGPQAGVKYYYYVVAYGTTGYNNTTSTNRSSGYSAAASATVTTTTVAKPTLKSVKATSKKVTLKWAKVSGAEGYIIYRSTKKSSGYSVVGSVTSGSTVKYVDTTATKGKTYYYKICAYKTNEAGAFVLSSYSAVKKVKAK